jgi:uncharacterized membrane protein YfhO
MFAGVNFGAVQDGGHDEYIEYAINGRKNLDMDKLDNMDDVNHLHPDNTFFRIDTSESVDNWCLFWGLSSMRNFNSVVAPSIMDFYTSIGQTRDVASRMETKLYALRGLFSVKYYFKEYSDKEIRGEKQPSPPDIISDMPDFKYVGDQNKFYLFENQNYVPMGFAYDTFVVDDDLKKLGEAEKCVLLMNSLVLTKEQSAKYYPDVIQKFDMKSAAVSRSMYTKACEERRADSCYYFDYNSQGFEAKIKLDKTKLVFFSVPFENGWSAEVNGQPVDIEKVSYGFMAVPVPAGDSTITFKFRAQGLTLGRTASVCALSVLVIYWVIDYDRRKKRGEDPKIPIVSRIIEKKRSRDAESK